MFTKEMAKLRAVNISKLKSDAERIRRNIITDEILISNDNAKKKYAISKEQIRHRLSMEKQELKQIESKIFKFYKDVDNVANKYEKIYNEAKKKYGYWCSDELSRRGTFERFNNFIDAKETGY